MQAIEFEAVARQHAISLPANAPIHEGQSVRVLLLMDEVKTAAPAVGNDEAFRLLTELSDDFFAEGREQPPLQTRAAL